MRGCKTQDMRTLSFRPLFFLFFLFLATQKHGEKLTKSAQKRLNNGATSVRKDAKSRFHAKTETTVAVLHGDTSIIGTPSGLMLSLGEIDVLYSVHEHHVLDTTVKLSRYSRSSPLLTAIPTCWTQDIPAILIGLVQRGCRDDLSVSIVRGPQCLAG